MMCCDGPKKKGVNYTASHAEIRLDLIITRIRLKAPGLKMTLKKQEHIKAIKERSADLSKDQNITEHTKMLSSALIRLTSFLSISASGLMGIAWIGLIHSVIMKLAMFDGLLASSKRKIDCREITGSISEVL